jgi:hypothetical protein
MICRRCEGQSEYIKFGYCRKCAKELGAVFMDEKEVPKMTIQEYVQEQDYAIFIGVKGKEVSLVLSATISQAELLLKMARHKIEEKIVMEDAKWITKEEEHD